MIGSGNAGTGPDTASDGEPTASEAAPGGGMRPVSSLGDLIGRQAESRGDAPFLVVPDGGPTLGYRALARRTEAIARALAARGLEGGASVAYATANGIDAVLAVLGIVGGGRRALAVNLVAGGDAIGYALGHGGARLVIAGEDERPLVESALRTEAFRAAAGETAPPAIVDVATLLAEAEATDEGSAPEPLVADGDADALLMYTSGTTGRPKGVVLSHANLLAGGANVVCGHALTAEDRVLCVLPLYHINGLCVTLLGPLASGGSVVMPARFSTSRFWDHVVRHRCSWFSVVPTQVSYLLHAADEPPPMPTLRFGRSASAPLAPETQRGFEQRFGVPLIETMGLTETAAQIFSNPMPPAPRRTGSPGLPVGVELRVVDAALADVAPGTEGEILVRGPSVMSRYLGDEAATRAALTTDGWLRTGDLGRRDADGFVFVTGRLKELIIKGGENIAPREIDEALYAHPDIVEAAAFGRPCERYGERVEAAVVLAAGRPFDEAALLAHCRERLGRFKCPERVHLLEELPKGPSGKIQRGRLREWLSRAADDTGAQSLRADAPRAGSPRRAH